MAVPTFRPDAKRDAAAREIVEGAAGWLHLRLRRPHGTFKAGAKFYGVPSSKADGSWYYTNLKVCSCADYAKRGAGCKHQRAVALHVAKVRAERARTPRPAADQDDRGVLVADEEARLELAFAALSPDAGAVVRIVR